MRIKDQKLLKLLKIEYDECEITGVVSGLHLHHVIFKSQQGDDLRSNIICISDELHDRYHAADPVARRLVAEYIRDYRQDVFRYIASKLGGKGPQYEWFRRHGVEVI